MKIRLNRADNLEWMTNKENHNYGTGHLRTTQHPNYIKSRKELSRKTKFIEVKTYKDK